MVVVLALLVLRLQPRPFRSIPILLLHFGLGFRHSVDVSSSNINDIVDRFLPISQYLGVQKAYQGGSISHLIIQDNLFVNF